MHEIHFDTIDSTQTYAKLHYSTFPPQEITCITAEEQTAGRGRYQRKWISPRGGNICATFCFQLPLHALHLTSLAQIMASSLAAILSREGLHPKIKWPNDLQLRGKKLAGVLCETIFSKDTAQILLGIGINVNMEATDQIDQPATSLFLETEKKWDRGKLLKDLQRQFAEDLERFKKSGFASFHKEFERLLAYKGETVRCFDGKREWVGICHSITSDGQLNIVLPDHTIHRVSSGELSG